MWALHCLQASFPSTPRSCRRAFAAVAPRPLPVNKNGLPATKSIFSSSGYVESLGDFLWLFPGRTLFFRAIFRGWIPRKKSFPRARIIFCGGSFFIWADLLVSKYYDWCHFCIWNYDIYSQLQQSFSSWFWDSQGSFFSSGCPYFLSIIVWGFAKKSFSETFSFQILIYGSRHHLAFFSLAFQMGTYLAQANGTLTVVVPSISCFLFSSVSAT